MRTDRKQRSNEMRERLRAIRQELYGYDVSALASALNIPEQTWRNYEAGVVMPAEIMLGFLVLSGVDPGWMLNGH